MLEFGYYNLDCMEGMKEFPDKYFDLAVVDPEYGRKEHGGKDRGTYAAQKNGSRIYPESVKLIVFICQSTIRLAKSRKCTLIMLNKPVLM